MPRKPDPKTNNLTESLAELERIVAWFESQEEPDVEEGLKKAKEGAKLLASCRERLRGVENEFEEIKKSLEE